MSYQYLRYSGEEFHPLFALFTENLAATEVNVAVSQMVEASGEAYQNKVTGEFQWNEKDSYLSLSSDADPEDDSAPHDGQFITAAVKMYKRVRFFLIGKEMVVLTRHPNDTQSLRQEYLEDKEIFYGTATIDYTEEEHSNNFFVVELEVENDPDLQLPPMMEELKARVEDILNTGTTA